MRGMIASVGISRAEPVQFDPVACFGRDPQHRRPDRGDHHRRRRTVDLRRGEIRRHQREFVVLALVGGFLAGLPAAPDRAQYLDVFAHARRRRGPGNRKAPLVMRPDLRAEPDHEPPAGRAGEVPADLRRRHRRARETDRDPGMQFDPRRGHAGDGQRERIVLVLHRDDAVIPLGLDPPCLFRDKAQIVCGTVANTRMLALLSVVARSGHSSPRGRKPVRKEDAMPRNVAVGVG